MRCIVTRFVCVWMDEGERDLVVCVYVCVFVCVRESVCVSGCMGECDRVYLTQCRSLAAMISAEEDDYAHRFVDVLCRLTKFPGGQDCVDYFQRIAVAQVRIMRRYSCTGCAGLRSFLVGETVWMICKE